jgi:alpha-L-rhamnosidase
VSPSRVSVLRRSRLRFAAMAAAGVLAAFATLGAAPGVSAAASSTPWPANPGWQSYDETPTSATVCPTAVTRTSGSVSGASGLLCGGSGGATLTLASGGTAPTIVLDYGKDVGGIPFFNVSAESGSPTLRAGYSEGLDYLSATGDGAAPWAEGDGNRYDDYAVTSSGTITNQYVQGGERYEHITLTTPGSVTLAGAGITYIADRTQAGGLAGWFNSSNSVLNKIWYDSEYTDQLDSVPAKSLPGVWSVSGGALQAAGDPNGVPGLLSAGSSWGDYTVSFQTDIVANQAGWFVRGQDVDDGYLFILDDSADTSGTANTLQEFNKHGGAYTSLGSVALPSALVAGSWHTVSTTVSGSTLSVSLDGTRLTSLTDAAHASGTVGFREYAGEQANFRNLTVTSSSGATLFSDPLSSSAVLSQFAVPGVNPNASIVDGAKRDRAIWSGDMNVEIPSVFYSTDNTAYLKGALQMLATYARTDGSTAGDVPPQYPLGTSAQTGSSWFYSADYSTYFVLGLADYYRFSGDTAFVQQELPVMKAELAWNAGLVDANGLMATGSGNNMDWDFYDSGKSGEVTEYNLLYYKSLLDGATLAAAAGDTSDAATYTSKAAALKTAINARLYNSSNGLYSLSNNDTNTVAQDANALAVLYNVAPASDIPTILSALKTDLWTTPYGPRPFSGGTYADTVSPYISGYELDARLANNDTADAEALLTTVWGHMAAAGPEQTGTTWENVSGSTGLPGLGSRTNLSHGWSTTPVSALSGYVLGVQPATAGYATWTVQPHPGDLAYAQGSVPTPHGAIAVNWAGESGVGQFSMTVTAPSGTSGTVAVPTYGAANPVVEVNGHTVWSNGAFSGVAGIGGASADATYVYLTGVQPGSWTVAANPGNYGVPAGYTKCADEGSTCAITGTQSIAFGANGIYSYTTSSSSSACTPAALGDPDYGAVKSCYVGPVVNGPTGAVLCAAENGLCSFSGTRTVEYGAGSTWTSKALNGGTPCGNAVFGDPAYGVVKSCFVLPGS